MLTTIYPSVTAGTIQAPASKSSMQRACAAALLHAGETIIRNPGYSNDDQAALRVIRGLGAVIETLANGSLRITGQPVRSQASAQPGQAAGTGEQAEISRNVNCGESGLGIRMFAPIIALSDQSITVNGEGSLLSRPMDFFDEIFPQLGILVKSNGGKLPLQIQGPLQPRDIEIDGSLSSQFLTGLLMAYAAAGAEDVSIHVRNLKSKPYIDLTLQVMARFGWKVENRNYESFYFPAVTGAQPEQGKLEYTVEGDWSGGAFLLVAGALAGRITVAGLDTESTQADKAILKALRDSGAFLSIRDGIIEIGPAGPLAAADPIVLQPFHFDATDCPDLFPPLVALAAYCKGTSTIHGVDRLAHKESNRGIALQEEFGKMGVGIELQGDRMLVKGGSKVKGARVHSHHDHRIAMACAVAGLRAEGITAIEEAQAIGKSYPDFYQHLQQLGADVSSLDAVGNEH